VHRTTLVHLLLPLAVFALPGHALAVDCAADHFVAGQRTLPTHGEAMAQCRAEELAMTDPDRGNYEAQRSCYDVTSPGMHGEWQHGRIAVDVVERESGDAYTFEALWMCKPLN